MPTYVLIHGAGSDSWYWHLVVPELQRYGHEVVAMDLPCDDDSAGLAEYTDTVVEAVGDRTDLVVVAQSLAGFTAPLVCERRKVDRLILVAAMIPVSGESPGDWWGNTGHADAVREQGEWNGDPTDEGFDARKVFFHDVPAEVADQAFARGEKVQSGTPFEKPWPLEGWPDVPTRFLLCRDDRFFPAGFMRRVVHQRLGIVPDEIDGGHLPAFSRPKELAARLDAYPTG
ncbi:MAG TPA: alpha/beta hydrolase [Acidimicrobiales bacterium]|jgi:pimeloyl-ACP methyl ester carboxylesterase|nr:alpha/beta hydrolase [Acidimicrobiales bacterium]